MPTAIDYTGQKFHKLTAIKYSHRIFYNKIPKRIWTFQCECGAFKNLTVQAVVKGDIKHCGCSPAYQYSGDDSLINVIFTSHHYNDGDLTFEQFKNLINQNCFYCHIAPHRLHYGRYNKTKFIKYNGLDRMDNDKKHNLDNVIPCCWTCNQMKRDMSFSEFLNYISNIYHNCCEAA